MKKLTKAQVKALIKKQGTVKVWLCPSKAFPNPSHPFNVAGQYDLSSYTLPNLNSKLDHFDRYVNEFQYYNCNSELGNSVHYYIEA